MRKVQGGHDPEKAGTGVSRRYKGLPACRLLTRAMSPTALKRGTQPGVAVPQKTRFRPSRLRTRTKGCGVLGVGALDTEATRCPECGSILNQGRGCCNLVFTLISRQVFPLAGC